MSVSKLSERFPKNSLIKWAIFVFAVIWCSSTAWSGPVGVSSNKRYLVRDGKPLLVVADTGWFVFGKRGLNGWEQYVNNRAAKGFTAIFATTMDNFPSKSGGPFQNSDDITKPNMSHWNALKSGIAYANSKGIVVFMTPCWMANDGRNWGTPLSKKSAAHLQTYGKFLGNHFKSSSNVVWFMGGDANFSKFSKNKVDHIINNIIKGIKSVDSSKLMSYHPNSKNSSAQWYHGASWLNFNQVHDGTKTGGLIVGMVNTAYNKSPTKPVIVSETGYEERQGYSMDAIRRTLYRSWFSGGFGVVYGHMLVYDPIAGPSWTSKMNAPGATQIGTYMSRLMKDQVWHSLKPDSSAVGGGAGVLKMTNGSGSRALSFFPTNSSVTVKLNWFKGKVKAQWFNTKTGQYKNIAGSPFANSGSRQLAPGHSSGAVLVLTSDGSSGGTVPEPTPEPTPTSPPPPPPPGGVGDRAHELTGKRTGPTTIQLSWKAPAVAVKEYRIVLGANERVWKRVKVVDGSTLSTTLTSANGITKEAALLQVRAMATSGKGLPMSEQLVVPPQSGGQPEPKPQPPEPTPQPPSGSGEGAHSLTGLRTGPTTIQLSWKAPAVAVKEFRIVLGANDLVWKRVKVVSGSTLSTTLTSSNGIRREAALLQVRAMSLAGKRLPMSEQLVVPPQSGGQPEPAPQPPEPSPQPPTGSGDRVHDLVGERTASTTIKLSWKAPALAVSEYRIVLGAHDRVWKRIKVVNGATLSTTLTSTNGITSGTALLQIRAMSSSGKPMPMSDQISVAPLNGQPEPAPEPTPEPSPPPQPNGSDGTIVAIPDTQNLSQFSPGVFKTMVKWIANNANSRNIKLVTHLGDMVNHGDSPKEMNNANNAMSQLNPVLPKVTLSVCLGNHDYKISWDNKSPITLWAPYFGRAKRKQYSWYGGDTSDDKNHYSFFNIGGYKMLSIDLQFSPTSTDINWLKTILNKYPKLPTMITTHAYLSDANPRGRGPVAKKLWPVISTHKQVFMVIGGHYYRSSGSARGEIYQVAKNKAGLDVIEMLADYQYLKKEGWLRIMQFRMKQKRIDFTTYSPTVDKYMNDSSSRFSINMDFAKRFGSALKKSEMPISETTMNGIEGVVDLNTVESVASEALVETESATLESASSTNGGGGCFLW